MHIQTDHHKLVITSLTIQGRLDAFSVPQFRAALDSALDEGSRHLVIDLRQLEFLDSAGMAVLVNALKRMRQDGGDVRMLWPHNEAARRILHLTKFDRVFPSIDSLEAALQIWQ